MNVGEVHQIDDGPSLHLRDYWRIVWDGRWTVLAVSVAVFTVVTLATFLATPIYRAQATVDIQARARRISPVTDVGSPGLSDFSWFSEERYFNTQFEIVKSRAVLTRVFEKFDLGNDPRFKDLSDPVATLMSMVRVEPVTDTGIVRVSMESPNAEEVARWVNALVEAYVERNMETALEDTRRAFTSLLSELEPLRARLQKTDSAKFEFAEKSSLFVPKDDQNALTERLKQLEAQQTEARVKRIEIEAVFNKIEEISGARGSYLSLPRVNSDPTIRNLNEEYIRLEKDLNRLLVSFKGNHPRVSEKRSELEKIRQKIEEESGQIINAVRTEYSLNREREVSLAREIERTRAEALKTNQKASSYDTLAADASETRRIFELFSTRIKEISLTSELLSNNIRVLDRAVVPRVAVKPRKALNLGVGLLLALGLGMGTVFFLEYLDNTVKSSEDIEKHLGLSVLAVVPRQSELTKNATWEAYQTLRTSLLFSSRNRADRLLLITSTIPREGKSTVAVTLARTLGAAGDRVCVVECDLRRPVIHEHLTLRRHHGLTNYLMSDDETSWRTYLKKTDVANVDAITCGAIPPNPPQVFGSERFVRLLQLLKAEYDVVLLDSPPLASLTDSIILASVVDMVALVVRYQQTDREVIRRVMAGLRNVSANVVGAILNDVDPERSQYKSHYDYGYYLSEGVSGYETSEVGDRGGAERRVGSEPA